MPKHIGNIIYRNIPNIVSLFGVIPLALLFSEQGFLYLIPLIINNNIMDDLDGVLAAKLELRSDFGAILDNVCDAVSHTLLVMVIGMHYGMVCGIACSVAAAALLIRVVSRLDPKTSGGTGSPTNELIRHSFFALLLADMFSFNPAIFLIVIFLTHSISMIVPYPMLYIIRNRTKTPAAIGLVNIALISAWLLPVTLPIIAGCFIISYLYSGVKIFMEKLC